MNESRRFQPGDVVVGDWAWGVGAWLVHPVIRVNRRSVTVGIHRVHGGWLTTETLRWDDIRGVIPAVPDVPSDTVQALTGAATRLRRGYLDTEQHAALSALLLVAGSYTLPTPVTAVLFNAVTALTRTPRDESIHHNDHGENRETRADDES